MGKTLVLKEVQDVFIKQAKIKDYLPKIIKDLEPHSAGRNILKEIIIEKNN
jgi:hypothetical protein